MSVSENDIIANDDKKHEKIRQYEYIAHQIDREDQLVNFRLTWLLAINGLLFTALAFIGGKDHPEPNFLHPHFKWALALIGLMVSCASLVGVIAAYYQLHYLTDEWEKVKDAPWPRPFGDRDTSHTFWLGLVPSFVPPAVLTLVWLWLLLCWAFSPPVTVCTLPPNKIISTSFPVPRTSHMLFKSTNPTEVTFSLFVNCMNGTAKRRLIM